MRGLAGAVLCESRDLGIKRPQWHTLLLEEQVAVSILEKVGSQLKGGVWLDPIRATLRRKVKSSFFLVNSLD